MKELVTRNYERVCAELDSLILIKILTDRIACPWSIWYLVKEINELTLTVTVILTHLYREDNGAADSLANWGAINKGKFFIDNFSRLPRQTSRAINLDRCGVLSLRRSPI